jgi:nitrous oxide reductase accessory protein NosL
MKRSALHFVLIACILAIAGMAQAQNDIQKSPSCTHCGMDRTTFAHSRMVVAYDDGTTVGTCSIHCLAIDLIMNMGKMPNSIKVGDFNSKELIDAEKAFWVIGGKKPGVMSKQGKWAFAKKEDAEAFAKDNGGNMATFDDAMKASFEGMYADVKMIREKRQMKGHAHQ